MMRTSALHRTALKERVVRFVMQKIMTTRLRLLQRRQELACLGQVATARKAASRSALLSVDSLSIISLRSLVPSVSTVTLSRCACPLAVLTDPLCWSKTRWANSLTLVSEVLFTSYSMILMDAAMLRTTAVRNAASASDVFLPLERIRRMTTRVPAQTEQR